MIAPILQSSLR